MHHADTMTTIWQHHRWSNLRLLDFCERLTPTQWEATIAGSFGSIHATWQHIALSEQSYFSRISTGQRLARPENAPPLTQAQLRESLQHTGEGLIAWAHKIQADEVVNIDWDGTPRDVPKTILLTQALNHATLHREQICAILTEIGLEPPDLQAWEYFDELYRQAQG